MHIQVLTFHLSDDQANDPLQYCRSAALGLAEHDGFVSVTPVSSQAPGSLGLMVVWRNWRAVEAFRRSELYARLQMSPSFEAVDDRTFGVTDAGAVAAQSQLLAVA